MQALTFDDYVAGFEARWTAIESPRTRRVDGPAICGLVPVDGTSPTDLLVHGDEALGVLSTVLPMVSGGTVRVHDAARRCADLIRRERTWTPSAATAMVCQDLRVVPEPSLPAGLTVQPVRRVLQDPVGGVPLKVAVAAAARATSASDASSDALTLYLKSLPGDPLLFAALDQDGIVRGTSGSRTFGTYAYAFFINTDPGWRRRGVGLAMTASALRSSSREGATRACLDASDSGAALYGRLGFTAVAQITQFSRPS